MMSVEESESDLQVPQEFLFSKVEVFEKTNLGANARVWGLALRQQTPNFEALRRLLNVRYHQATDDVPHEDLLSPL
jgi:hypothetical protein